MSLRPAEPAEDQGESVFVLLQLATPLEEHASNTRRPRKFGTLCQGIVEIFECQAVELFRCTDLPGHLGIQASCVLLLSEVKQSQGEVTANE